MKFLLLFSFLFALTACKSKYIQQVNPDTKAKFGFEITAPNKAVFFVENKTIESENISIHNEIANSMYNKYGPARDNFHIANTDAKDFKFNLNEKTYCIEVEKLPKRTAMILFDGKQKPTVEFNPKKYNKLINQMNINQ